MLPIIIWLKCSYFCIKTPMCTSRFMTQDSVKLFPVLFSLYLFSLSKSLCWYLAFLSVSVFNEFQFVSLFHISLSFPLGCNRLWISNTSRFLSQSQVIFWISVKEKKAQDQYTPATSLSSRLYVMGNCLWTQKAAMLDRQTNWSSKLSKGSRYFRSCNE